MQGDREGRRGEAGRPQRQHLQVLGHQPHSTLVLCPGRVISWGLGPEAMFPGTVPPQNKLVWPSPDFPECWSFVLFTKPLPSTFAQTQALSSMGVGCPLHVVLVADVSRRNVGASLRRPQPIQTVG